MGKFADTLKEHHLSPELTDAIGAAESIYGTVSGAYAYYGAAYAIGEKLGLWGGGKSDFDRLADALANVVNALREGFAAVLHGQDLQSQQGKIDALIDLESGALGALSILNFIPEGGHLTAGQIDLLIVNTNCDVLLDDSHWTIPYFSQTAHTDAWSGAIEPPHDQFVPAYAIMVPRYLQAIGRWVAALAAAFPNPFRAPGPGDPPMFHHKLLAHADKLAAIHDVLRSTIVTLRAPTAAEVSPQAMRPPYDERNQRYWQVIPSDWQRKGGYLYGAVELYSTTHAIAPYPEPPPPPPNPIEFPVEPNVPEHVPPPPPDSPPPVSHFNDYSQAFDEYMAKLKTEYYPRCTARHAAMSLRQQKIVYNDLGLGNLWAAMNRLRVLAGEVPLDVGLPPAGVVRDGDWSIREFHDRVPGVGGGVSAATRAAEAVDPLSIRALGPRVGIPPDAVGSLRQVFLDAAGAVPRAGLATSAEA